MNLRRYTLDDLESCLAIFDRNVPRYFDPSDREEFSAFLRSVPGVYLVGSVQDRGVVACGGWYVREADPVAGLTWGMVDPSLQGKGLGRALLEERLRQIREDGRARVIRLRTTQRVQGFFERAGFMKKETLADGFGPGLDRVDMELTC